MVRSTDQEYQYRVLNTGGRTVYVLHRGETAIGAPLPEVAICFDAHDGVLHKHGEVSGVQRWAKRVRQAMAGQGARALSDDLVVVSGHIPVVHLNKMLSTSGYCRRWYESQGGDQ